jgi:hypothetical protein
VSDDQSQSHQEDCEIGQGASLKSCCCGTHSVGGASGGFQGESHRLDCCDRKQSHGSVAQGIRGWTVLASRHGSWGRRSGFRHIKRRLETRHNLPFLSWAVSSYRYYDSTLCPRVHFPTKYEPEVANSNSLDLHSHSMT